MKCARRSDARMWRNMGSMARRRGLALEAVLTGKTAIDAIITEGFEWERQRSTKLRKSLGLEEQP